MVANALLTSNSQTWETPDSFYLSLHKRWDFTIDVCALPENTKHPRFFSPADNGLAQSWAGERCFMNPPYAPPQAACKKGCNKRRCAERGYHFSEYIPGQIDWIRKAYTEVMENNCELVACLLPARTDTVAFHEYVMKASEVFFIKGRLQFVGAAANAVFPSMVVLYDARCKWGGLPIFNSLSSKLGTNEQE